MKGKEFEIKDVSHRFICWVPPTENVKYILMSFEFEWGYQKMFVDVTPFTFVY